MSIRYVFAIATIVCAAAATPLASQQTRAPAGLVPASHVQSGASNATLPGPRQQPRFQSFEPRLASSVGSSSAAVAAGQHTIVISTLALACKV